MLEDRTEKNTALALSTPCGERPPGVSRRGLFKMSAATALILGFHAPCGAQSQAGGDGALAPNAFIKIDRQGDITLIMPQVEMGQGTYTAISMILAEELDADWSRVKLEHAPPDEKRYANPMLGMQATGNSNSVRAFWKPLRQAGAGARALLVQAAASQLHVSVAELRTQDSQVIHDKSGRRVAYAALVDGAAMLEPPADPPLKDPKDFHLIGRSLKRLDTPDKTNGKAQYRHRRAAAGREIRHHRRQSRARRHGHPRRRRQGQGDPGRSPDRDPRRSRGCNRRPYVGREVRARSLDHHLE